MAVLIYHHISDTDKSNVTITPALLRSQLSYLQYKGYRFITLDQFRSYMLGGEVPDNAVLVTFDDGYKSFYDYAYPILRDLQVPAVNFVVTYYLDDPYASTIPSLSRAQVVQMVQNSDLIDVQCHSDRLHDKQINGQPLLTSLLDNNGIPESTEQYRSRIVNDTRACVDKLHELQSSPTDFYAYPYGIFDKAAVDLIRSEGLKYSFTVVNEMATRDDDPMQIPRINAGNPSITPTDLHNLINRRAMDLKASFGYVPLRNSVGQIGGTVIQDKDGTINFYYHGKHWSTKPNSSTVMLDNLPIPLRKPIVIKGRKAYIDFGDLQNVMGIRIVFHSNAGKFYERITPLKSGS